MLFLNALLDAWTAWRLSWRVGHELIPCCDGFPRTIQKNLRCARCKADHRLPPNPSDG